MNLLRKIGEWIDGHDVHYCLLLGGSDVSRTHLSGAAQQELVRDVPGLDEVDVPDGRRGGLGRPSLRRPLVREVSFLVLDWIGPNKLDWLERAGLRKDVRYLLSWSEEKGHYLIIPRGRK